MKASTPRATVHREHYEPIDGSAYQVVSLEWVAGRALGMRSGAVVLVLFCQPVLGPDSLEGWPPTFISDDNPHRVGNLWQGFTRSDLSAPLSRHLCRCAAIV
jgi:hypothetical protein